MRRKFSIFLVKPSHYDADGYVIQWYRSSIPSNSLASVYGLLAECAAAKSLGPDVDIEIDACDECNTVVDVKRIIRTVRAAGGGFVGLVGVQSNQFPRALDLARKFRAAGVPVVIGGFHVSGCLSMLPELPADLKEAQALGIISSRVKAKAGWRACSRISIPVSSSRSTTISTRCRTWRQPRCRSCRAEVVARSQGPTPASTPDAVARSNAASAPSSTFKAASPATGQPTT